MSRIYIDVYDGESYEYDKEEDNKGSINEEESSEFRDGEELLAAMRMIELLDNGKHFDVRQWVN